MMTGWPPTSVMDTSGCVTGTAGDTNPVVGQSYLHHVIILAPQSPTKIGQRLPPNRDIQHMCPTLSAQLAHARRCSTGARQS